MVKIFLIKPQMTKTSQDNNLNYINLLKHFYEYHTEKLKYRDMTCIILKVLPWWICYYCFCSHIQSLVELESVIVATAPYFVHTAPLTFSLWFKLKTWLKFRSVYFDQKKCKDKMCLTETDRLNCIFQIISILKRLNHFCFCCM